MIRAQRRLHAILWPLLAIALVAIIGAAMVTRHHVHGIFDSAPHAGPR